MGLFVLIVDNTLGEASFVKHLLEDLEQVGEALVVGDPDDFFLESLVPDILVLGASWLHLARRFRKMFPTVKIIGRGPWQGEVEAEFFPWGDQLREPSLPLTELIVENRTN